jgi:tetratricopeptide (TPR) repeat protein
MSVPATNQLNYPPEAIEAYSRAIELNEKLAGSIDDPKLAAALADKYLSEGKELLDGSNLVGAEKKLLLSGNFSTSSKLYTTLAQCYFKQERWDASALMYKKALSMDTKNTILMAELARACVRAGKNSVAIEMFCRALIMNEDAKQFIETESVKNDIVKALVAKAKVFSESGKHIDSAAALKVATSLEPGPKIYCTVGESYMKADSLDEAAKAFALAVQEDNSSMDRIPTEEMKKLTGQILFKRALSAYKEGVFDKATELFTLSAKLDRRGETYYNLADCAVRQKKTDSALSLYNEAIKINPELTDAYINAAMIYVSRNMGKQAIELLTMLVNKKPQIAQSYELMAAAFASLNQPQKAVDCYKQAVDYDISLVSELKSKELRKMAAAELYDNAKACYKEKQMEEAIIELKKAAAFDDESKYHFLEGNIQFAQGNLQEALESYKIAAKLEPGRPEVLNNLGNLYLKLADYENAAIALDKATKLNPNYEQAFNNLGICLRKQGKVKEAIKAYKSALKIKPDYASALFNLGNAYSAL